MELYKAGRKLKMCVNYVGITFFLFMAAVIIIGIVNNISDLSLKGWFFKGITGLLYLVLTLWIIHSIQTKGGFNYMNLDILDITADKIILRSNWDPSQQELFLKTNIKTINLAYCDISINGSPFSLKIRITQNSGRFREIEINSQNTDLGPMGIGGLTQNVASLLTWYKYPVGKIYRQLSVQRWFMMLSYAAMVGMFYLTIMAFVMV